MKSCNPKLKIFFLAIFFFGLFGLAKSSWAVYPVAGRKKFVFSAFLSVAFIILASFLFTSPAYGAEYYVSPTGSGTTCLNASPCSLTTGLGKLVAGDTLYFKDGTYTRSGTNQYVVLVNKAGALGNHITLKSEHPYGAKIDCGETGLGWRDVHATPCHADEGCYGFLFMSGGRYINVEDFEITGLCRNGGVWANTGTNNHHLNFTGNYVHEINGQAFYIGQGITNIGIYKNHFKNNGYTPTYLDGTHDIYIWGKDQAIVNNIFENNNAWGRNGYAIQMTGDPTWLPEFQYNFLIANNTFEGTLPATVSGGSHIRCFTSTVEPRMKNIVIENNISLYPGDPAHRYFVRVSSGVGSPLTIRNNIVYPGNVYTLGYPISGTYENNHDNTDPMVKNIANGDYHLLSTSPAISSGLNSSCPSVDYEGNIRPQPAGGICDIGAYEYISTPDTTPPAAPTGLTVN
ncbi:MAG: right-handed parallel beta-helix repeat-containing protein [Candidatus Gottesmanbacteria bacterium]